MKKFMVHMIRQKIAQEQALESNPQDDTSGTSASEEKPEPKTNGKSVEQDEVVTIDQLEQTLKWKKWRRERK